MKCNKCGVNFQQWQDEDLCSGCMGVNIAELQTELASYMESHANMSKRLRELEAEVLRSDTVEEELSDAMHTIAELEKKLDRIKALKRWDSTEHGGKTCPDGQRVNYEDICSAVGVKPTW